MFSWLRLPLLASVIPCRLPIWGKDLADKPEAPPRCILDVGRSLQPAGETVRKTHPGRGRNCPTLRRSHPRSGRGQEARPAQDRSQPRGSHRLPQQSSARTALHQRRPNHRLGSPQDNPKGRSDSFQKRRTKPRTVVGGPAGFTQRVHRTPPGETLRQDTRPMIRKGPVLRPESQHHMFEHSRNIRRSAMGHSRPSASKTWRTDVRRGSGRDHTALRITAC